MPLPIETVVNAPNALMIPSITVYTRVVDGKLVTAAHIVLQAAYFDQANETWTPIGNEAATTIDNVEQLPEDLVDATVTIDGVEVRVQDMVNQALSNMVTLIGVVNSIRKIK